MCPCPSSPQAAANMLFLMTPATRSRLETQCSLPFGLQSVRAAESLGNHGGMGEALAHDPESSRAPNPTGAGGPSSGLMFGLLMLAWLTVACNDGRFAVRLACLCWLGLRPYCGFAQQSSPPMLTHVSFSAEILEIFITITGAYITFYVSEDIFHVSGILAIVSLGFFMAAVGRSMVSPRVIHPFDTVWEMLEWGANTIIFILAGNIMAVSFALMWHREVMAVNGCQWRGGQMCTSMFGLKPQAAVSLLFFAIYPLVAPVCF